MYSLNAGIKIETLIEYLYYERHLLEDQIINFANTMLFVVYEKKIV